MAAAIILPLLIAFVPGCLGQFLSLRFQQLIESFLYTDPNQLFDLALDYFLVKLYNFLDMVCCLLSEWCVATSFYQSSANHVFFYPLF